MPMGVYDHKRQPIETRFWNLVNKTDGCWLWLGKPRKDGYGSFQLNPGVMLSHRFVWAFLKGPIPANLFVLHKCDVPSCVNPDHLFLGTQTDNMSDMDAKGRRVPPVGSRCALSKLTEADVLKIRKDTRSNREIAEEYGVLRNAIWLIKTGRRWRHI